MTISFFLNVILMVGFVISSFVYIVAVQRHFLGYS